MAAAPAGDRLVARLAQAGVEPGAALAGAARAPAARASAADLVVRRDRRSSPRSRAWPPRPRIVASARRVDEVAPLLGVEHRAEPRLRAVERPDRDDRVHEPVVTVGSLCTSATVGAGGDRRTSPRRAAAPAGVVAP